ncbi:hypothetical protein U9M48_015535 [Paspalum notatum var. saurae]|uniref:F-box domain-containing protein n=1 Tax=Paspalum notatum var. saurae TaxID=547442 RepID=A0AAQ3T523_PASNO
MGTEETDGGVDRISGLPDHLLHSILLRLPDTAAAARTGALSRRWRRVWAHLPELSFRDHGVGPRYLSPAHRRVDAALAAHAGATVTLLDIHLRYWSPAVDRAAPPAFLRFASRRVAGELRLSVRDRCFSADIDLTPCERSRTTAIALTFHGQLLRFQRPPPTGGGEFAALATLRIKKANVDTGQLGDAVSSSRCPRLKELFLKQVALRGGPGGDHVLSIRSGSLERLEIDVRAANFHARLHVDAPRLRTLVNPRVFSDADIVAPNLSEVCWYGPYHPTSHRLGEAGRRRHLQRLEIATDSPAVMLMQHYDTVHELQLTVKIWKGDQKYKQYLEAIDKLSKCEVLVVRFAVIEHAVKPALRHLLMKCSGVKKIVVCCLASHKVPCESKSCQCKCTGSKLRSNKTGNIALDLLEQPHGMQ